MFGRMRSRQGPRDDNNEYRLPPALARQPLGRGRLRREFVERNQRDRILQAGLSVFGTSGFATATVKDLIDESSVSRATFYKFFADKDACLLALVEEVAGWLDEEARDAARGAEGWPAAVIAVTDRLVAVTFDDPRLGRLCAVEALLGGEEVRARRDIALDALAAGLRLGRKEQSSRKKLPRRLELLLAEGALAVVARKSVASADPDARELAAELAQILLVPYLGMEGARRAVRPSQPRR